MGTVTLPTELERTIFEITAFSAPECIPKLVLVAWRVKIWLEPILYRTLFFPADHDHYHLMVPFLGTLASKPAAFFARSTRHLLMIEVDPFVMRSILSACSQVENLWVMTMSTSSSEGIHSLLPLVSSLPNLKHLYINLVALFAGAAIDFAHPIFSHLTHLELIGYETFSLETDLDTWRGLACLPCLTHLSFDDPSFIVFCPHLLEACQSLRVLVALWGTRSIEREQKRPDSLVWRLRTDFRFVMTTCALWEHDWLRGANGGKDYWGRAEEFAASRRAVGDVASSNWMPDVEEEEDV
ncbi:hypothetical protein C8R45DRAFT_1078177 [Mycena sanguinolenta]|nr:hypothetical protein C8R45DRAFT_1078177 [Mycena sanguinolenta]